MSTTRTATQLPRKIIVILGPTAVGKSSFAVELAKRNHGIIFSADSRQVYHGLNVGSGKITRKEMRGVPHSLLDIASPKGQYTAARFVRDFYGQLRRVPRTTPIFLVGGTPFYIDAALHPEQISNIPPNPTLRKKLEKKTTPQLLAILHRRDAVKHASIDHHNRRRIIRAIEISYAQNHGQQITYPSLRVLKLGLRLENSKLFPRIDARVDARMKHGMVVEVMRLHRDGISWRKLDSFGLEYRFLSRYLRKQLTKQEALTQLKSAIHDFARRQMTWWKRDAEIRWVTSQAQAQKLIRAFLQS